MLRKEVSKIKRKKVDKSPIPQSFINHIRSLGFSEVDAEVLYASKNDWMGISTGKLSLQKVINFLTKLRQFLKESKIECPTRDCKFQTIASADCLVEHCQKSHGWKDMPCSFEGCHFVAYNNLCFMSHKTNFHAAHKIYTENGHACPWKNCTATFATAHSLGLHMRVHTNSLLKCAFCPYRSANDHHMRSHYRFHYRILEYKCDQCDKAYAKRESLAAHISLIHTREMYNCHICNKYTGPKLVLQNHFRSVHNLFSRWDQAKKCFETFDGHKEA